MSKGWRHLPVGCSTGGYGTISATRDERHGIRDGVTVKFDQTMLKQLNVTGMVTLPRRAWRELIGPPAPPVYWLWLSTSPWTDPPFSASGPFPDWTTLLIEVRRIRAELPDVAMHVTAN